MLLSMISGATSCRGDQLEAMQHGIERWLLTEEIWKATRGAEQ
jgi:hypothetical protein